MTAVEVIAQQLALDFHGSKLSDLPMRSRLDLRRLGSAAVAAMRGAGFAVVPREATDAMAQEANGTVLIDTPDGTARIAADDARRVYRAMVAAAEPRTGGE